MRRIITHLKIENASDASRNINCDALVDTGAAPIVLPTAWRERLGELISLRKVEVELGNQNTEEAEICGPVKANIEGFPPIFTEVLFIEMKANKGFYEPLIGYIPLEQSGAAVDVLGRRLIPVRTVDLK